ncbi:MAG: DUF192 domain-containing protein [Planctomycetes bacterium]|nr:DUF192 domain-containing protein [Planctomycetota bacterium]
MALVRDHLTPRRLLPSLAVTAALAGGCRDMPAADAREPVTIRDQTFHLELSITEQSRTDGLMHRASIPEDGGMIFVFPDAQPRSFWMKNCLVDMDLIFLDGRGRVTALHRMKALPPRREDETEFQYEARVRGEAMYWSHLPAQFAIELRAGWLDRLDLSVDDRIELDLDRLKATAR